jgi:hypothetical protein
MNSLIRFVLVVLVALCGIDPLRGAGDPFLRSYRLALDDLGTDGDLVLTLPLCKWRLDDDTDIDVALEHRQESREYGDVRSRFDLRPFQTAIIRAGQDTWLWLRPGGGTVRFERAQGERSNAREWVSNHRRTYTNGTVRLTVLETPNRQTIDDDGWRLSYEEGALQSLRSPKGREFKVAAKGSCIYKIIEKDAIRAEIDWNDAGEPLRLRLDGKTIVFDTYENGGLKNAFSKIDGATVVFTYHESGMLASFTRRGLPPRAFNWRFLTDSVRGDSLYRNTYALLSADDIRYGYEMRNETIYLSANSERGPKSMEVAVRYGKIYSITERNRR